MKGWLIRLSVSAALTLVSVATLFAADLRLGAPAPHSFVAAPLIALAGAAAFLALGERRARRAISEPPAIEAETPRARRRVPAPVDVEGFLVFSKRKGT